MDLEGNLSNKKPHPTYDIAPINVLTVCKYVIKWSSFTLVIAYTLKFKPNTRIYSDNKRVEKYIIKNGGDSIAYFTPGNYFGSNSFLLKIINT